MTEKEIIRGVRQKDRRSQAVLWKRYAPTMMSICMRYLKDKMAAEDVLVNGMYRVMTKIDSYKNKGSFEGWMKRVIINECLMDLRKNKSYNLVASLDENYDEPRIDWQDPLEYEELISLLDYLPPGYRTVFNMYVIEGYKHREIADMLEISINTSKSQLILAKKRMRELIKKKYSLNKVAV